MINAEETGQLLSRTALRDRAAFAALYDGTSPKLFGICLRILRDRGRAEEALQEAYVKIWQRAGQFDREGGNANAWISAIARNQAIDLLRSGRKTAEELDEAGNIADPTPSPEQSAVLASEGRRIDKCMAELPDDRAQAVRAAYVDGYSYEELAQRYNVPLNTMRTWLRRALISLRECLER